MTFNVGGRQFFVIASSRFLFFFFFLPASSCFLSYRVFSPFRSLQSLSCYLLFVYPPFSMFILPATKYCKAARGRRVQKRFVAPAFLPIPFVNTLCLFVLDRYVPKRETPFVIFFLATPDSFSFFRFH